MKAALLAMPPFGTEVEVYRNRTRRCWSVRCPRTKRLLGHALSLSLGGAEFQCSEAGRIRSCTTGRRFVFAVVHGTLRPFCSEAKAHDVRFDSRHYGAFLLGESLLRSAAKVQFHEDGHVTVLA
jgi:hypothetical protein